MLDGDWALKKLGRFCYEVDGAAELFHRIISEWEVDEVRYVTMILWAVCHSRNRRV